MKSSSVPALDRGLNIIEFVAKAKRPVGFNQMLEELKIPKATLARIVKVLQERHYIVKLQDTGRYKPGPKMALFDETGFLSRYMFEKGSPLLDILARKTGNTALLLEWSEQAFRCLAKRTHPDSIVMQEVGRISYDVDCSPWGWICYTHQIQERQQELQKQMTEPQRFLKEYPQDLAFYEAHQFAYDDCRFFRYARRLAAPIFGPDEQVVGLFALGGTSVSIPDSAIQSYGALLVEQANALSIKLRSTGG